MSSINRKYITGIATPPEEDRAMAAGSTQKNLVKIRCVVSKICSGSDKQRDRQTDTVITILRSSIGGGVTKPG